MDFAPGAPLLASLDGLAALPRVPGIARRLRELAVCAAAIHALDPAPIQTAAHFAAPTTALTVDELIPHLRAGAEAARNRDLLAALDRLVARRPAEVAPVLCHGDLHPLNLLADGDTVTVLDWTAAVVAPASYDLAWTWLLLRFPPMIVPAALRSAVDAAGRFSRTASFGPTGRRHLRHGWTTSTGIGGCTAAPCSSISPSGRRRGIPGPRLIPAG